MSERKRSGGLLAIAVIAIVLGLLGGCVGCWGVVANAFQEAMTAQQLEILENSGAPPEQVEMQRQMQERILEMTRKWRIPTIAHQALNALASVLLLVAAILLLRWHPVGPTVFLAAAAANVLIDLGGAVLQAFMQMETSALMEETMAGVMAGSSQPPPPGMDRFMEGIMQASVGVGVCFTAGWVILKLAFYITGTVHLRKPAVRAQFAPPAPAV